MVASITFKSVAKQFKNESSIAELTLGVEKNTILAVNYTRICKNPEKIFVFDPKLQTDSIQ